MAWILAGDDRMLLLDRRLCRKMSN